MKTTSDCIGIREYLLRRGLHPHRETATHGMFLSPLREERTPSFSVRYDKGLWYDFGLGEGGTLLQLVMRLEGCGLAEAIRRLSKGSADEVPFQPLPTALPREDSPLRILGVGEIRHPALIGYLRERGIDTLFLCGLALDFCVAWTALHARRKGFATYVVLDACRAIDTAGSCAAAMAQMQQVRR